MTLDSEDEGEQGTKQPQGILDKDIWDSKPKGPKESLKFRDCHHGIRGKKSRGRIPGIKYKQLTTKTKYIFLSYNILVLHSIVYFEFSTNRDDLS